MKFYVYYNCGGCNDGDHLVGLEECEDWKVAEEFVEGLRSRNYEGTCVILNGMKVVEKDWP